MDNIQYSEFSDLNEPIDVNLPLDEKHKNTNHFGRHFCIRYVPAKNTYTLQDLGRGFGTFYNLTTPVVLKNKMLFNISSIFLIVQIEKLNNGKDYSFQLYLKLYKGSV